MWARVISGLIGVYMLYSALGWILDPASAADVLKMTLVEGPKETTLGMNTQIGDFTSFFFTAGIMACIGAYRKEHVWLYGTISLLGSAAVFRTSAGLFHGADFVTEFIVFEALMSLLLLLSVYKMKSDS